MVLEAWDRGALLPRLLEPSGDKEPRACEWCEVSAACVRGESAHRRRLREWATRASSGVDSLAPAERALLALYLLGGNPVAAAGGAEEEP